MFYHHADDLDVLPVGVHGGEIVIEGDQFKHLLSALVDAAGPVLLEGGLFAAVLGYDEIPWLGRFVGVNDDEVAFFKEGFHRLATQPEAETTRADIDPCRHKLDVAIEGSGLLAHLVPVAGSTL